MQTAVYNDENGPIDLAHDYEGIQWLRHNVGAHRRSSKARTPLYRWGSRFSIYTGLPAVLGWDWHQMQQRGSLATWSASAPQEVDEFYGQPARAEAQTFLRKYDVSYVILGRVEQLYYPAAGLRKFESGLGGVLEVAYQNDELTIYRVKPRCVVSGARGFALTPVGASDNFESALRRQKWLKTSSTATSRAR